MDKPLREILERCLREMERGGRDIETVLADFPQHAEQLRPYLDVAHSLECTELPQPRSGAQQDARRALLDRATASSSQRDSLTSLRRRYLAPMARDLAVLALLTGAVLGTSAAAGHGELLSNFLDRLPVDWTADQRGDEAPEAIPEDGIEDIAPTSVDDHPEDVEEATEGPPGEQDQPLGEQDQPPGQQDVSLEQQDQPPGQQGQPPGQEGQPPGRQGQPCPQGQPPGQEGQPCPQGQPGQAGPGCGNSGGKH